MQTVEYFILQSVKVLIKFFQRARLNFYSFLWTPLRSFKNILMQKKIKIFLQAESKQESKNKIFKLNNTQKKRHWKNYCVMRWNKFNRLKRFFSFFIFIILVHKALYSFVAMRWAEMTPICDDTRHSHLNCMYLFFHPNINTKEHEMVGDDDEKECYVISWRFSSHFCCFAVSL